MNNTTYFSELFIFGHQAGKDGQNTLRFENGEINFDTKSVNSNILMFTYKSASTGKVREARFDKSKISGFSWTKTTPSIPPSA